MSDPITFSSIFDPDSTVSVHLGVRDSFVHGQVVMPDSTLSPLSYWGNVFLLDGKIYYNDLVYFGVRLGPSWQFDKSVILNDDPAAFTEGSCPDSQRHPVTGECIGDMTTRDTGETLVVRQGAFFAFGAGVDIPVHRVFDLGLAGYVQRDHGEYGNESNPEVLYRATDLTTPRPEYDVLQEYGRWGGDAEISARFRTKFIDARIGGGGSLGWESTASTNEGVEDTQSGLSHRWHFGLGLEFHAARDGKVPERKQLRAPYSPQSFQLKSLSEFKPLLYDPEYEGLGGVAGVGISLDLQDHIEVLEQVVIEDPVLSQFRDKVVSLLKKYGEARRILFGNLPSNYAGIYDIERDMILVDPWMVSANYEMTLVLFHEGLHALSPEQGPFAHSAVHQLTWDLADAMGYKL